MQPLSGGDTAFANGGAAQAAPTDDSARRGNPLDRWLEVTVGSLLIAAAERAPHRPALQWPTATGLQSLSWSELLRAATHAAHLLRDGPASSGPVAIWGSNSVGWYVSLWAAALSGRPLVPVNPSLTASEAEGVLRDCGASTMLASPDHRGRDLLAQVSAMAPAPPELIDAWDVDQWWRGPESPASAPASTCHVDEPASPVRPADTFLIQYTSGTTGPPKGAMLSHRACVNSGSTLTAALEPTDHEIWCSPMPLHHVGATIAHCVALAGVAGTYVMVSDFSPAVMVDAAARSQATLLAGVPTIYLRILEDPALSDVALPHLRVLMLGGASIPAELVSRIEDHFNARVAVLYGQSEAPAITQTRLNDSAWIKANTLGRPLPHRELRIVDTSTGDVAPAGQTGEIHVRTAVSMDGYLNRPDQTSATIDAGGWLHTGDLGALDRDGLLHFHGRLREMIVRGGENVYAVEVERVIEAHPGVSQVAVVGMPDPHWGEIVVAVVVPLAGTTLREQDLRATAEQRLAHFKRPAQWHIVDGLPLTASGKPQKFKIIAALTQSADANRLSASAIELEEDGPLHAEASRPSRSPHTTPRS